MYCDIVRAILYLLVPSLCLIADALAAPFEGEAFREILEWPVIRSPHRPIVVILGYLLVWFGCPEGSSTPSFSFTTSRKTSA